MDNFMDMLVFALATYVAFPSSATSSSNSVADCQKIHAGDNVKI